MGSAKASGESKASSVKEKCMRAQGRVIDPSCDPSCDVGQRHNANGLCPIRLSYVRALHPQTGEPILLFDGHPRGAIPK
jgi:hypothetical protein